MIKNVQPYKNNVKKRLTVDSAADMSHIFQQSEELQKARKASRQMYL